MSKMEERKTRVGLEVSFKVKLLKNNLQFRGSILDLSEGGIKFKEKDVGLIEALEKGDQLLFATDVDFYGIQGRGEVKWLLKNKGTAGMCFLGLDEKSRRLLNEFLSCCLVDDTREMLS